jgi:glycosyltransferase involved in cell wall biosynthesis
MSKILIDARMASLKNAGIGRYALNLLANLNKQNKKNMQFILITSKNNHSDLKKKFKTKFQYTRSNASHYSLKEQFEIIKIIKKINPDIVHFLHFNVPLFLNVPYIVTIHDLIKHKSTGIKTTTRFPLAYWFKFFGYQIVFRNSVKKAKKIIVPTKYIKNDLVKTYPFAKNKVTVIYEGADKTLLTAKRADLAKEYNIKKPYLFYIGSLYPHKNIDVVIRALREMKDKDIKLVVATANNVFYKRFLEKVKKNNLEKRVVNPGFIKDEHLQKVYKEAKALIFPSKMEGFGLPGLEAMLCGCPVISSNASCLPEVYSNAALYFDPDDHRSLIKKINSLDNPQTRKNLIKKGRQRVKKFSWGKTASQTLNLYNDALNKT